MDKISVSQSKVKTWRRCRRAYHYKYVENLTKKRTSRPLQFGRLVHEMIEAHANAEDPFELLNKIELEKGKMFRAEREMYGDIINDIRTIMVEYFDYWKDDTLVYLRKNKKSAEHEFEIEILDGIYFKGKIDAIAKSKKMKWLVEHKTFTRMPTEDHRWRNIQSCVYVRALDVLGWNVEGTCWDYVKSKPPTKPEILKSGAMSTKMIDSLPGAVMSVLEENELDPKLYDEFIAVMRKNRPSYFQRIYTPTKKLIVDSIFEDFKATAIEISELHGKSKTRTIDLHCDYCDYESICRAELIGLDSDFVKEREYTKDEKAGSEEPIKNE